MKNLFNEAVHIWKKFVYKVSDKPWLQYYKNIPEHLEYYDGSMYSNVKEASEKFPNNIALEYFYTKMTYKDLINKIEECAKSLKAIGVKENETFTICMPNTIEAVILFYAVNKIGAIANVIHPLSSENEIEFYINKASSKYIFAVDFTYQKILNIKKHTKLKHIIISPMIDGMDVMTTIGYKLININKKKIVIDKSNAITYKEFINLGYNYKEETYVKRDQNDLAVILYSGGTTGKSKGIMLSNLCFNAIALECKFMVSPKEGESILSAMPIFHGFGLGICIHTPLTLGMKCILVPQMTTRNIVKYLQKKKPNFLPVVPTLLELITKEKSNMKSLSYVKCILCGGDFLNFELKTKVEKYFKEHGSDAVVRIGYGLTECTASTCVSPIEGYKNQCIGIPFPDNIYKIVKVGTIEECKIDEDGEICINGPSVMLGYLDDKEETMHTLVEHNDKKVWLHTGDIGCIDKNGLVYFKSRLKRIIISSGYNIYPSQLEEILNKYPKIFTSTVIGIHHPTKVQVAKAFIVLKEGIEPTNELKDEIKAYCKKNMAKYAVPYVIEFRESIPKTKLGKVAYRELS